MAEDNKKPNQVFDVAKPGKTPASSTSRPVIVGHGPMLKDPMVNEEEKEDSRQTAPKISGGTIGEKVVEPPKKEDSDSVKESSKEDKATEESPEKTEEKKAEEQTTSTDSITEKIEEKEEDSSNKTDNVNNDEDTKQDKNEVQAVNKADTAKKNPAQSKEDEARQKEIEKLIEEKKYFVPIGQVAKKRNNTTAVVALFIVLLAICGYLAVDAGLILKDVVLPLDLIK